MSEIYLKGRFRMPQNTKHSKKSSKQILESQWRRLIFHRFRTSSISQNLENLESIPSPAVSIQRCTGKDSGRCDSTLDLAVPKTQTFGSNTYCGKVRRV